MPPPTPGRGSTCLPGRGRGPGGTARSCCRFRRWPRRSRRPSERADVTEIETTAHATGALLDSGAIMLGAALLFVLIFRKLRLGATLGYIVAGALIGPHLLGLIDDPEDVSS